MIKHVQNAHEVLQSVRKIPKKCSANAGKCLRNSHKVLKMLKDAQKMLEDSHRSLTESVKNFPRIPIELALFELYEFP